MKSKTTKNTKSLLLGLFLAIGLMMFGNSQAAGNDGVKVSKQFVDEMSKIDPSYKKLVKPDASGTLVDFNDPAKTKALLDKAAATKEKKEVNKNSNKLERVPTSATKNASSNSTSTFGPSKNSKTQPEKAESQKDKNLLGDVETRKHIEKRIEFEKAKLNSTTGEELVRLRKSILELEKMRTETFNVKK